MCLQGGGVTSQNSQGSNLSEDVSFTLNDVDRHGVAYGISAYESNAMKSSNPHSGIYKAETARTLDLTGGSPACNQGGVAVMAVDCRNMKEDDSTNGTLQAKSTGGIGVNFQNVVREIHGV